MTREIIAILRVVLGTTTATPPRWMLDLHPVMLAVDAQGNQEISDRAGTTAFRMRGTGKKLAALRAF